MTYKPQKHEVILQAEVGSSVWGLSQGGSDRDEMGICVEGLDEAMGVGAPFENYVYRTAAEREHKHDAPSQDGDLDLTIYSLRKWVRLALKGNPTILTLLFVPPERWVSGDSRGAHLQELAPYIVSRQAGKAFLGYLQAQRMRLNGERGGKDVNRKELEEKYGYDTKYAMHMLRLGFQGVELLREGRISLPMLEVPRHFLLGVRRGESSRHEVLTRCGELEAELRDLLTTSPLPEEPDTKMVEEWMLQVYWETWKSRYYVRASDSFKDVLRPSWKDVLSE